MPFVIPDDVTAKIQTAVNDRDDATHADDTHTISVKQLTVATAAEAAAKDALLHLQAQALQSAHDAIDAVSAWLAKAAVSPVTP